VQAHWKKHVADEDPTQPQWTLRSIRSWLQSDAPRESIKRDHLRLIQRKIELCKETQIARRHRLTGKVVDNPKGDKAVRDWLKLYHHIDSASLRGR
jgi:hypothetical protein